MRKVDTISAVDLDINQSWCQDLALEINRRSCSKCFFPDRRILARIRYEAIDRAWIVQNHARDGSQKPIYPEGCGAGRQVAAVWLDEVTVSEPDQSAVNMEVPVVDHIGFLELYQDLRNEPQSSGEIGGNRRESNALIRDPDGWKARSTAITNLASPLSEHDITKEDLCKVLANRTAPMLRRSDVFPLKGFANTYRSESAGR
jgi:hypothetical protein